MRPGYLRHFFVRSQGRVAPINVNDIVRLQAEDDYTAVHANGSCHLVHLPLRDVTMRLDPGAFVRVHRSAVVNLAHVRIGEPDGRRVALRMSDGSTVFTSRIGKSSLRALSVKER